jgi:hypothetical protein
MTELLLGCREVTPEAICGCCARIATSVGVIHPRDQNVLWLCEICSPKHGLKVADMNPTKLSETEAQALDSAAAQTMADVVDAVFTQLWAHGIRDLEALNSEVFGKIISDIAASADYREAVRNTFLAYGQNVRTALTNMKD